MGLYSLCRLLCHVLLFPDFHWRSNWLNGRKPHLQCWCFWTWQMSVCPIKLDHCNRLLINGRLAKFPTSDNADETMALIPGIREERSICLSLQQRRRALIKIQCRQDDRWHLEPHLQANSKIGYGWKQINATSVHIDVISCSNQRIIRIHYTFRGWNYQSLYIVHTLPCSQSNIGSSISCDRWKCTFQLGSSRSIPSPRSCQPSTMASSSSTTTA